MGAKGPRDLGPYQVLRRVARDRWSETLEALGPAELAERPERPTGAPYRNPRGEHGADDRQHEGSASWPCLLRGVRQDIVEAERLAGLLRLAGRVAPRLRHPHLVDARHCEELGGRVFLVSTRHGGRPLSHVLRQAQRCARPLPRALALHLVHCLALGLEHGHGVELDGQRLVHGAVHPQHVLLGDDGSVRLKDFAESVVRRELALPELTSMHGGYLSPEQIKGQPLDARSDIFALGVLLYHLICQRPPFQRSSTLRTLAAVATGPIRPPRRELPDLSGKLEAVMLRALERERERRYLAAASLAARLEEELAREPTVGAAELAAWLGDLHDDVAAAPSVV